MKRFSIGSKYEFCPNGNYWTDVSGVFDQRLYLFCDCKKCGGKVYELKPFDITKKISQEQIDGFRKRVRIDDIKYKINSKNIDDVEKLINSQP